MWVRWQAASEAGLHYCLQAAPHVTPVAVPYWRLVKICNTSHEPYLRSRALLKGQHQIKGVSCVLSQRAERLHAHQHILV